MALKIKKEFQDCIVVGHGGNPVVGLKTQEELEAIKDKLHPNWFEDETEIPKEKAKKTTPEQKPTENEQG